MTVKEQLEAINARLDALETLVNAIELTPLSDLVAIDTRIQTITGILQAKVTPQ